MTAATDMNLIEEISATTLPGEIWRFLKMIFAIQNSLFCIGHVDNDCLAELEKNSVLLLKKNREGQMIFRK